MDVVADAVVDVEQVVESGFKFTTTCAYVSYIFFMMREIFNNNFSRANEHNALNSKPCEACNLSLSKYV